VEEQTLLITPMLWSPMLCHNSAGISDTLKSHTVQPHFGPYQCWYIWHLSKDSAIITHGEFAGYTNSIND